MKNCIKLEEVAHFLESTIQVLLDIIMKKPALAGHNEVLKQKASLSYSRAAAAMSLRDISNTGFF